MKNALIVGLPDDMSENEIKRVSDAIFHIKGVQNIGPTVKPFEYHSIISEFQRKVAEKVFETLTKV